VTKAYPKGHCWTVDDLPPPPEGKTGFPWTEGCDCMFTVPNGMYRSLSVTFSIVTPSYNQGDFLEETIRSVLLQGYPADRLDYIIIDGGSTDQSVDIIRRYAPFLSSWVSEPDKGQTNAINKGFSKARGHVMGWLNSDDILMPYSLQEIDAVFRNDWAQKQKYVVCGLRYYIDADSNIMMNWTRGIPTKRYQQHRNIIPQETAYWRREVWEDIGDLDESLHFCMDLEYWQRMLSNGYEFEFIPHYIGGFRQHDESKTHTIVDVYRRELALILQRYNIAQDEADALQKLGIWWGLRYDLIKDLCHQSTFDDPKRAYRILQFIQFPYLSIPLLIVYWLYRGLRGR